MSQPKPSETNDPLRDSLAIAAASLPHSILCPCHIDMFARCTCGIEAPRKFLVDRIDAAIAEAEAATEERIASKLVEWAGLQSSLYAASALEHAAAAIRAREEK